MVPQVGQRIGPYEILGKLGAGGMGLVFSAWDARLHRDVAIKILREEYASPDMRSRFLQEARAASGLNHPNICTIFDIGEQDGDPFLVMELLKGETLRQRMNEADMAVREICRIGHDIADALSVAHGRNIIHRDIKPANIFVVDKPGGGFMCKVLDFGLAKIDAMATDQSLFDLTHTGTTVGTVSYMSPEQARGESLDTRSDLFSLGVILYEMACGRLPFQGQTSALVFVELLSKPPDAIRPQNPDVPEELEYVIQKLLEKDRTLRFQNASQVMEALSHVPAAGMGMAQNQAPVFDGGSPRPSHSAPLPDVRTSSAAMPSASMPAVRRMVQIPQTTGNQSATHSAARPPLENELRGRYAETTPQGTVPADEILRPRRRTVASDSSTMHRAMSESAAGIPAENVNASSGFMAAAAGASDPPAADAAPRKESATRLVSDSAQPSYDLGSSEFATAPTRPIVPQSARANESKPSFSLNRVAAPRPTPRFSRIDEVLAEDIPQKEAVTSPTTDPAARRRWLLPTVIGAVVVAGLLTGWMWPRGAGGAGGAGKVIPILLTPVTASSGDTVLAGAVAAGLSFDLAQAPQFLVEDNSALDAGLRLAGLQPGTPSADDTRKAARAIGATEVLFTDLRANGSAYSVALHIQSADTGAEVFHAEQTAQSREQIPDALDRLMIDLRTARGGSSNAAGAMVPLSKEATANIEAMEAYGNGVQMLNSGRLIDAATQFERAVTLDAHFTQAQLQLADLYRSQNAMVSAATAAVSAQSSSQGASLRTQQLAAASAALNATDDVAAISDITTRLMAAYPNSVRARIDAAAALTEQGKYGEAFDSADSALHRENYNALASAIGELDLVAQDRPVAARAAEEAAEKAGRGHPALKLLIAYLANGETATDTSKTPGADIALSEMQASLLDATGQPRAALQAWRALAAEAASQQGLYSAAGDGLSQAGFHHALTGDCTAAASLAEQAQNFPLGLRARLRTGIAAALCGDTGTARSNLDMVTRSYPQSFALRSYGAPELNALIAWRSGNADGALQTLQTARQFDNISLIPYLRGTIHLRSGRPQEALLDFQVIVQHPGAAALISPMLYPMAQIGLARAYAASGDRLNASVAYNKFLTLWSTAEPGSPLVTEARSYAGSH